MKRTFAIMMLVVYPVLTAGMTVIVHTCGGESETILAVETAKDPCACGEEMPTEMCCTTEIKTIKIDDDQKVIAESVNGKLVVLENLPPPQFSAEQIHDSGIRFQYTSYVSPPPNSDLTIINSVFLI